MFCTLSCSTLEKRSIEAECTKCGNNAGTGGTESAGKIHEMDERTWDFVM